MNEKKINVKICKLIKMCERPCIIHLYLRHMVMPLLTHCVAIVTIIFSVKNYTALIKQVFYRLVALLMLNLLLLKAAYFQLKNQNFWRKKRHCFSGRDLVKMVFIQLVK